jgi:ribosomal protein S18 acetylase RimI-like enzyme
VTPAFLLRPASFSDRAFLFALHCATMREVVEKTWGRWDEAWQRSHFEARFDPDGLSVITVDGRDAGALRLQRRPAEIYVAEIEIGPEVQGRGIGTTVLRAVMAEAAAGARAVTLQVLKVNVRAQRLYERLGFEATGETETHVLMRHPAGGSGSPS